LADTSSTDVGLAVHIQHALHKDGDTAPPNTALDEITRHSIANDFKDAVLQILQPGQADHRLALGAGIGTQQRVVAGQPRQSKTKAREARLD
jgi:hypothetical protein